MRAGGCTVQQTLTSEAASILKHSLSLARRRGHAQVTPLHVASTLLASKFSLFRRACLKSQSQSQPSINHLLLHHHHQSRALELCFNVALNRLPTIPPPHAGSLLQPSFSNALIAALKRAQAHQRKGSIIEQQQQPPHQQQQQQPLLAIKVELEQLILSILDDPSVSRVMREAGFSSTAVKTNLQEYYSSVSSVFHCSSAVTGIYSTPSSPPTSPPDKKFDQLENDIKLLEEVLLSKMKKRRRNAVIISDSIFTTENLVSEFMSRVERGGRDVPEGLRSVCFVKFMLSEANLKGMNKEEVEMNVAELKRKVENLVSVGKGVIIYIGNLKWMEEGQENLMVSFYRPVDHLVAEIGKLLVSFYGKTSSEEEAEEVEEEKVEEGRIKVWLLATANYQTYMRCQMKQPSLDVQWSLQAVSVPSGGLGLSLNANARVHEKNMPLLSQSKYGGGGMETTKPLMKTGKEEEEEEEENFFISCCPECTSNYEKELASKSVHLIKSCKDDKKFSNEEVIPHWLNLTGTNVAHKEYSFQLKRKWSKLCQSLHGSKQNGDLFSTGKNYCYSSFSSSTPNQYWWPSYNYRAFSETKPISFASNNASLLKPVDHQINQINSVPRFRRQQSCHIEFNFSTYSKKNDDQEEKDKEAKITLALGSSLFSEPDGLNSTRQQTKCDNNNGTIQDSGSRGGISHELLKEIVPWQSKNIPGILEALRESSDTVKNKNIWVIFQGNDSIGKRKLALGIAEKVLGSTNFFLDIDVIRRTDKYSEVLENAVRKHDRLVVLLENIEFADTEFLKFLADGWRSGKFGSSEIVPGQVIFILSKLDSTTNCSHEEIRGEKRDSVIEMKLVMDNIFSRTHLCADHKRKIEWDFTGKKKLTRQVSSNILDLNVKAEEELSSITTATDIITRNHHLGFLDLIENRFLLNREPKDDTYIKDLILSKIEGSFEKVFGNDKKQSCFSVEECVLEKMVMGYGSFLDSLFEKWLKDILQTSLSRISGRIEEGIVNTVIKLCLGSNNKNGDDMKQEEEGFMGSCLPKNVEVEVCLS